MKNFYILLILLFITFNNSFPQSFLPEWVQSFNSNESAFDYANNIAVDSLGNVYVTGKSYSEWTEYDYLTIKYNSLGNLQWSARYNGPGNFTDEPTGIVVDKSGNIYVTGFSYGGSSDYDYTTIKYNSNGVQQWVDRYNGVADSTDKANSITLDGTGNIIISGQSFKLGGTYNYDCMTIKYNSSGSRLWIKNFEMPSTGNENKVFLNSDQSGNIYVVGYMTYELLRLKYNNNGNLLWNFVDNYSSESISFDLDFSGNQYISTYPVGGGYNCSLMKFNTSGIKQWTSTTYNLKPKSIKVDSSGNSVLTGIGTYPNTDIFTIKFNTNGVQQWNEKYGATGPIWDESITLTIDISGNVYVAGYSNYPSSSSDCILLKYNSSGIRQWISRYDGPLHSSDRPQAIGKDYYGNIYVTGYTVGLYTEIDYLTIKYPNNLQLNANILLEGFYNESINKLRKKDTLTAYIRNITLPYNLIDSGKAIVDTSTFLCGFCFKNATPGTYYITIKHRNSIETWSKQGGVIFAKSKPTYYDFTSTSSNAFGNNLALKGEKYCLFSGDVNQDKYINLNDIVLINNDAANFVSGSFLTTDLTGDNTVDLTDVTLCFNNASNFISVINP